MKNIVQIAQAWMEHCRYEIEYFMGEDDEVGIELWNQRAEEAEKIIKNHIDGGTGI